MNAPAFPWIDPPPAKPVRQAMRVKVATDVGGRVEYDGLFATTFDAYDDALSRFVSVARIEVKALPTKPTKPLEVPHAL